MNNLSEIFIPAEFQKDSFINTNRVVLKTPRIHKQQNIDKAISLFKSQILGRMQIKYTANILIN